MKPRRENGATLVSPMTSAAILGSTLMILIPLTRLIGKPASHVMRGGATPFSTGRGITRGGNHLWPGRRCALGATGNHRVVNSALRPREVKTRPSAQYTADGLASPGKLKSACAFPVEPLCQLSQHARVTHFTYRARDLR